MPDHQPVFNTQIPVHAVQDENATVVAVEVPWHIIGTGSSKREPGDQKNYARGYRLALGRALVSLGRAIERSEREMVKLEIEQGEELAREFAAQQALKEEERERTRPEREARAAKFRAEAVRLKRSRKNV